MKDSVNINFFKCVFSHFSQIQIQLNKYKKNTLFPLFIFIFKEDFI